MFHWISLKLCTDAAAILWSKCILQLGCNNTLWSFSCISKIFYQIYCVIFSYIPFTFPQTSKCFLSNGTKNMHILASGPELQAVRFEYVISGENLRSSIVVSPLNIRSDQSLQLFVRLYLHVTQQMCFVWLEFNWVSHWNDSVVTYYNSRNQPLRHVFCIFQSSNAMDNISMTGVGHSDHGFPPSVSTHN